jgi:hypothetical protein
LRRLQGSVTESLRVALPSFRKLYDLLCDCVPCRTDRPVSLLEGDNGHLERDAQETNRLGIKPVALQVSSDRHGMLVQFTDKNLIENMRP